MVVVFVEPCFPKNQRDFVRGLKQIGATVVAIGESPKDALDEELKDWLLDYIQVPSVCDERAMIDAVKFVQSKVYVDRLEATVEAHILPIAKVRAACTIPGLSVETSFACRDKPTMKDILRAHNIPCAQSLGSGDPAQAFEFAHRVGYPLIVKPRTGAGAAGTSRVDSDEELGAALNASGVGHGGEVAIEEFIEGHEAFYDTITINGTVVHEFVSHYYPNVLEAMRTRWISPQFIATNRVDSGKHYQEVKEMGRKVISAIGITTAATHMEWFFGPKGLKFSEIGCRPPGVRAWDLYDVANDLDLYLEWASAITTGQPTRQASRRFSAGIIALRPECDGWITGYSGLDQIQQQFGQSIIDCHFPELSYPTNAVGAGYMANAWIRMKHPDYDELRSMLDTVGRTVKVHARAN